MTTVQEFKCIFCKEGFDDKEALQIHFRKHGDPQFNQSKTKTRPQYVAQTSGEQSRDGIEMVGCDVCSEVFPTISKAITHKHKVHPDHDAKYFCPWCGKLFTMKHLYNKHLQASHGNKTESDDIPFHCDCCEVDFYAPVAMLYHNKFFHRQDTDIPAFGHSKKLKMHNQEVLQIYYCSFCGEEYVNKVNLHKHTIDDHSDENQSPDEVLRCPLCDAIFYHLDAYEIHLTFHSVEDLYSEKNELMNDITEFSLEAVPPSTEKVENLEPQQDAETTMAEMSFDDILQLAADQSSEQLFKKSKKHKKHKKSKKSAITLDEFLNMNKDVFGEGLDFQGVEEVPTRAITKRLKVNKKAQMPGLKTIPELDKLRKQGIIIKKKSGDAIMTKPHKVTKKVLVDKSKCNTKDETKLSSSSEVLSKLISQSNNEIQIIKKGSQDDNINLCEVIFKEGTEEIPGIVYENEKLECDSTKNELGETAVESKIHKEVDSLHKGYNTSLDNSDFSEKNTSQDSQDTSTSKSECPSPSVNSRKDTKLNNLINEYDLGTHKNNENLAAIQSSTIASVNLLKSKKVSEFGSDLLKVSQNADKINTSDMEPNSNIHDENGIELDTNVEEFCEEPELPTTVEKDTGHSTSESLSALKHLSHLITVKPVHQVKNTIKDKHVDDNKKKYLNKFTVGKTSNETSVTSTNSYKEINDTSSMTESALKNLGKNIILKSLSSKFNDVKTNSTDFNNSDVDDDGFDKNNSQNSIKELSGSTTKLTNISVDDTDSLKPQPISKSSNYTEDLLFQKDIINNEKDSNKTNSQLLKHLTSITAKPLNITKTINKVTPINTSTISRNIVHKNITRTVQNIATTQDDIEIFNIDDSDDDMDNINQKTDCDTLVRSIDPSKNFNKNVSIVNSRNPQKLDICKNVPIKNSNKEMTYDETQNNEPNNYVNQSKAVPISSNTTLVSQKITNEKNVAIKNALKALGKNITIKSRNSSPIHIVKHHEQNLENDDIAENDADSDTDSCSGKVKITEVCEDHASDEEVKQKQTNQKAIIQMPDDSCSENETNTHLNEDTDDQESDFETHIKTNTVKKCDPNIQSLKNSSFNSFRNISKDITIKSTNTNNREQISKSFQNSDNSQNSSHISLKPMRLNKIDQQESNSNTGLDVRQKLSMNSVNQKTTSSSNQVNKEVTVKTFQTQTKTVIQEITTTVTKTIKTVNQTVKEELRNTCQSTSMPMTPQKIQGTRVCQKPKTFQGVTVRHAISPGIGPQIRNPLPIRPNIIRASNQLVPVSASRLPNQIVRSGTNVTRLNNPRVSAPVGQQKIRPAMGNIQIPNMGKPLKISTGVVVSPSNKRPNSEEPAGPFSCFKKSKESLIPVSEIPTFSNSDDTKMEYSSSVQMSKSNYMSTVKTVKGNSVVTSTQMKSETSASSQQLNKLSSMSGLRVVKTSQNKQVQETSETSGMKQTTLEAIEKLQKQGLLIKKPRLDHSEESEHLDGGDDDDENIDYSAVDERNG